MSYIHLSQSAFHRIDILFDIQDRHNAVLLRHKCSVFARSIHRGMFLFPETDLDADDEVPPQLPLSVSVTQPGVRCTCVLCVLSDCASRV